MIGFSSSEKTISKASSLCICAIITKGNGFKIWFDFLPFVIKVFNSQNEKLIDTIMDCLCKIVEDLRTNSENFNPGEEGDITLNSLIPYILKFA